MSLSITLGAINFLLLFTLGYGPLIISAFIVRATVNGHLIRMVTYGFLFITGLFLAFLLYWSLFGYFEVAGNNVKVKSFGNTYSFNVNEISSKENINLEKLQLYRTNGVAFLNFKAGEFKDKANNKYIILSNSIDNQKVTVADMTYIIPASIQLHKK